jgi:hypothetical protein
MFELVPVDTRLRCREVCRGWRAVLEDWRLWECCVLAAENVTPLAWRTAAFLEAATARAQGRLRVLTLPGWVRLDQDALLAIAKTNAATLRRISCVNDDLGTNVRRFRAQDVRQILAAAPALDTLECDVASDAAVAADLLSNGGAALQLRTVMLTAG